MVTGIAVDGSGNAYLAGSVANPSLPVTSGAFQRTDPDPDNTTSFVANFAPSNASETTITSSNNPQADSQSVTLTAHVAPVTGNAVPTGVVNFSYRDNDPVNVELDGSGNASYTTPYLPVGENTITALYVPATGVPYSPSTFAFVQTITGQVAAPTFTPAGGTHATPFHTLLETASPGATILLHDRRDDADHSLNAILVDSPDHCSVDHHQGNRGRARRHVQRGKHGRLYPQADRHYDNHVATVFSKPFGAGRRDYLDSHGDRSLRFDPDRLGDLQA